MATVRMTSGAVLGGIANAAQSVSEIFDTVGNGARFVNNFAKQKLHEQEIAYALDREEYTDRLIETRTMEAAERYAEIDRYCKDPENLRRYNTARERFEAAVKRVDPDYVVSPRVTAPAQADA